MAQQPGNDQQAMIDGMGALLESGAPPATANSQGAPPPGLEEAATSPLSDEGPMGDVVATLAMENAQLRELVGLGPDDPIPAPGGPPGGMDAPAGPPQAVPGGAGLPPV